MTLVEIVSKSTMQVVDSMNLHEDETFETVLYWVKVAIAAGVDVYAQFVYRGSLYLVSNNEELLYGKQI